MCSAFVEFLFPTVPPDEPGEVGELREKGKLYAAQAASCPDDHLEVLVGYLKDGYDAEEARRDRVNTRLTSVIAIVGVTVTLASSVARDLVGGGHAQQVSWDRVTMLVLLVLSLLYFVNALRHAFLGLKPATIVQLGTENILQGAAEGVIGKAHIHRNVARFYASAMIRNRYSTNRKLERVTAAQQHVLRAAFLLFVAVIVAVVGSLIGSSGAKSAPAVRVAASVPGAQEAGASELGFAPPSWDDAGREPRFDGASAVEPPVPDGGIAAATADSSTMSSTSSIGDAQTKIVGVAPAGRHRNPVPPVVQPSTHRPTADQ
jgi:hypothetical protein